MKKLISLIFLVSCGAEDRGGKSPVSSPEVITVAEEQAAEPAGVQTTEAPSGYPQTLYIATLSDLPDCGEANTRQLIYVAEDASFRACVGAEWIIVEANTVTKTETIVEKAMPAAKEPVIIEGFGNWGATNVVATNGAILSQVSITELSWGKSTFSITNGITVVLSETISNYRLAPAYSKAPFLNGATPIFSVSFIDWVPAGIHVRVWQDDVGIANFWDIVLTKK